jgi:cobaltochelatase CobN
MHLLATQTGVLGDGNQAVDLQQDPADIVILSAADSDLACLARAHDRIGGPKPTLRLANLMRLQHNYSVDLYVERTLSAARLIIVRLLGGRAYWPYGVETIEALARGRAIRLAVIPGGGATDPSLERHGTVSPLEAERLRRYFACGGLDNAERCLRFAAHLLGSGPPPEPAVELPRAGFYRRSEAGNPAAALVFYRALIEGGFTAPVDALIEALRSQGIATSALFVEGLKDEASATFLTQALAARPLAIVINATGFAVAGDNPLSAAGCPVLQAVFAGTSEAEWRDNPQGLSSRDLAMNVVLPELDGRIMTRALSFKSDVDFHGPTQCRVVTYAPSPSRIAFTAHLASSWIRLARKKPAERRIAIVLANYPNRDGRIGNGVGYDTPASTINILKALAAQGYDTGTHPAAGNELIAALMSARTELSCDRYRELFGRLPHRVKNEITARWGEPVPRPFRARTFGNIAVAIQPARGYDVDPKATYHDPALVPPHDYLAFYLWLRHVFDADAVIHNGKHGNLEWLPGKAVALSEECYPEAVLGPLPQLYPFIVNDPGEGAQAKRRTSAVIIDHLTPPLTRAESYGVLRELEALVDEYYTAMGMDRRRAGLLRGRILDLVRASRLDLDAGIAGDDSDLALRKLDAWLCDLKEAQIRDGLHVLGEAPQGVLETGLLTAFARVPRGLGEMGDQSLPRALAHDLGLEDFDPLSCGLAEPWTGPRPPALAELSSEPWRTAGDTVERLELLAARLIEALPDRSALDRTIEPSPPLRGRDGEGGDRRPDLRVFSRRRSNRFDTFPTPLPNPPPQGGELQAICDSPAPEGRGTTPGPRSSAVLADIASNIRPALRHCGKSEIEGLLNGLDGRFVEPGPAGAPTRGRIDVLPTGRNFYSIDNRAVPTPTAWSLGQRSADALLNRHFQEHGHYPRALGLSAWGTANMRTGGDDIAQALAFIGVKPVWDTSSWRVTGFEVMPLAVLGRPRIDLTLRISGFFRDAFPLQIELFDKAVRAVGALDENEEDNPIAARMAEEARALESRGAPHGDARRLAGQRIFGSKPGAYGAGLQALIDAKLWDDRADLARAYVVWGSYAYGAAEHGSSSEQAFQERLRRIEAVVHNQDNREHDVLDSDDYYQFEGGMTAAVEQASGIRPLVYHNDHSRPDRPIVRTLEEEIGRVVRSRVVNPKWIAGVRRHGYKGAFEIAATVDYLFAFAATTGAAKSHHFDLAYEAFIVDRPTRDFLAANNPAALKEIADRFSEAATRGLWTPRSNSAYNELEAIMAG